MDRLNRLYLARHGQVVDYEIFPVNGHTDVELTEVGILQFERLAERLRLADIQAIYSSDLKRCVKGAQIIARYHDAPMAALEDLREMYFGDWEGLTLEKIRNTYPDQLEKRKSDIVNYQAPGNGESIHQLSERILTCLKGILKRNEGKDICLVGHGAVNRVVLSDALNLDLAQVFRLHQDYGCLNIIDYLPDTTVVRLING